MADTGIVDESEKSMGIISFMSPEDAGFDAVLKARYSDFVVHEVGRDGELARLESLEVTEDLKPAAAALTDAEPGQAESTRKRKQPDTDTAGDPKAVTPADTDPWSTALTKLSESVGSECAEQTISVLRYWDELSGDNDNANDHPKFVVMPELADKQARRGLHESVRSHLSFCAVADTHEGRVRIWHKGFEKEMPNYGKFDRGNQQNGKQKPKQRWPSDRPDFLQFVLYKENVDTSVATKEVIRRLSHGGKRKVRVGYAGMKDKRGVTSQFCTLYRQDPAELLQLNREGKGGGGTNAGRVSVIRVGNFRYVDKEIHMGMLRGNRFNVALRNVHVALAQGNSAASETDDARTLRTKEALEMAALSFLQRGFINYFGMQRFGKYHDTHKVGVAVLKGDFERAVGIIMDPKPDEQPRSAKARDVWAKRFQKLDETDQVADAKARAEATAAREALRDLGRFMTCEVAILNSLARKPLDYKRAFCCIPKSLRLMFLHALQSYLWNRVASQRISAMGNRVIEGDLVLTEDKDEANGGSGTSGLSGKRVKAVDSDDISEGKFSIADIVLPLVGTKIQYPTNESGSMFDSILKELDLQKEQFGKVQDRELNVGGDYRRVVCLPADVEFKVVEYTDPLQPLLHTDLMQLGMETVEVTTDKTKPTVIAMTIEFTLPPSSYATIALRELMKRPTSSNYQSEQRLERHTSSNAGSD